MNEALCDRALAAACADSYDPNASWENEWDLNGTHLAHRKTGDVDLIVFRGSHNLNDWMNDFEAVPQWDDRLGFVHNGFMEGMNEALAAVLAIASPRVVVTGHSLGGARARILAALLAYSGRPVEKCTVFGSPRPAFANLARVLQKTKTPLASYRNRNDPVPLVPYLGGLYQHPDAWVAVSCAPADDDVSPLRDHHIGLYLTALKAVPEPVTA